LPLINQYLTTLLSKAETFWQVVKFIEDPVFSCNQTYTASICTINIQFALLIFIMNAI